MRYGNPKIIKSALQYHPTRELYPRESCGKLFKKSQVLRPIGGEAKVKTNRKQVRAVAYFEDDWWEIELPDLGTHTATRSLNKVQGYAEECAALWLDVEPETLEVLVEVRREPVLVG